MSLPHSAGVVIPLRSLRNGKLRLAHAMDPESRALLIQTMAARVVAAAHDLDVLIVHEDDDVADWAHEHGARALSQVAPGLNEAVSLGRDHLRESGYDKVLVAHGDLPLAIDLRQVVTEHRVSVVTDRHGDGTNVLCVDAELDFRFAYGPGSFANHVRISRDLGIEPHIVDAPDLAWDVDHPDDLPPDLLRTELL